MGIENLIKGLVPGISDEKAQQAIQALRSGKMSDKEAQELGFTSEVQAKINEYFAKNGEAQIGDYVLFGLGDDPQDPNYFMTQTAKRTYIKVPDSGYYAVHEYNENTREVSVKFYDQMGKEIKDDKDANGKVTRTAEQKFAELTKLDPNGKYGVQDGYLVQVNDAPSKMDVALDIAKETMQNVKNQAEYAMNKVEEKWDSLSEGQKGFARIGTFATVGGLVGGGIGAGIGLIAGICTGCSPEEPVTNIHSGDINVEVNSNQVITMPMSLNLDTSGLKAYLEQVLNQMINENRTYNQAILDALQTIIANQIKQGATLEAILSAIGNNDKILEMILKALMQGNQLLQDVRGLMETNNKQNDEILKVTLQILEKLNGIEKAIAELTAKFPGLTAQLNAILNAIKNNQGGTSDPTAILAMLEEVIRLLKNIDKSTAATEETTRKILAAIQKLGADQAANFAALIDAINNNYGGHGPDYTNLLNLILAKLEKIDQHNQAGYEALLNKMDEILQAIKDHHVTVDVTGTVTCNCNCGNNNGHEGIIDDITGLIS